MAEYWYLFNWNIVTYSLIGLLLYWAIKYDEGTFHKVDPFWAGMIAPAVGFLELGFAALLSGVIYYVFTIELDRRLKKWTR